MKKYEIEIRGNDTFNREVIINSPDFAFAYQEALRLLDACLVLTIERLEIFRIECITIEEHQFDGPQFDE